MRQLFRNKSTFYLLNYLGYTDAVDSDGYKTGEKIISYSSVIEVSAHVSGARGSTTIEVFGSDIQYDKTISMSREYFATLGINENSVFFLDKEPEYSGTNPLYNYTVERIATTINEVVIAVKEVRNNG